MKGVDPARRFVKVALAAGTATLMQHAPTVAAADPLWPSAGDQSVAGEIWVGTARDQGLARFRFPTPVQD